MMVIEINHFTKRPYGDLKDVEAEKILYSQQTIFCGKISIVLKLSSFVLLNKAKI